MLGRKKDGTNTKGNLFFFGEGEIGGEKHRRTDVQCSKRGRTGGHQEEGGGLD